MQIKHIFFVVAIVRSVRSVRRQHTKNGTASEPAKKILLSCTMRDKNEQRGVCVCVLILSDVERWDCDCVWDVSLVLAWPKKGNENGGYSIIILYMLAES